MLCISPWNFPLAIFLGQVVACLVAGNAVIAKPAEQTPLVALEAVNALQRCGVPTAICQCVIGGGDLGAKAVKHPDLAGVLFTGSTATAQAINQSLAARPGAILPLIAETGGQNAMIVDSTALPEQLILDIMTSAFGSAGQRCSALRVLCVQEEVADRVIDLIQGAMACLKVGKPEYLTSDVGPVVDQVALNRLQAYQKIMDEKAKCIAKAVMPPELKGTFCAPSAYEISSLDQLSGEIFGPILHVMRYRKKELPQVIEAIHATGYGLTGGLHSRVQATVDKVSQAIEVGNFYVNRNTTGAVVGVQPFGGQGLSGTGPKAGGPHYLQRLVHERTLTIDTTAAGGNASLMTLES